MAKKKKAKKTFTLTWAFEPFEEHDSFFSKSMFGGLAAYVHEKMVMVLVEDPEQKDYRGKTYDFPIWDGIMIPTYYEYHEKLQKKYPDLIQHPVLKKWLFIKRNLPNFEELALECGAAISNNDEEFGIYPKVD